MHLLGIYWVAYFFPIFRALFRGLYSDGESRPASAKNESAREEAGRQSRSAGSRERAKLRFIIKQNSIFIPRRTRPAANAVPAVNTGNRGLMELQRVLYARRHSRARNSRERRKEARARG